MNRGGPQPQPQAPGTVRAADNAYLQRLRRVVAARQPAAGAENPARRAPSPPRGSAASAARRRRAVNYAEDQIDWELEQMLHDDDESDDDASGGSGSGSESGSSAGDAPTTPAVIRRTAHKPLSQSEQALLAAVDEDLAPLRLNLNLAGHQYEDRLLWNLNDPVLSTVQFGQLLCDDLSLPRDPWVTLIAAQLDRQIGAAQHLRALWAESGRAAVEQLVRERGEGELRVPIKLDIIVGDLHYFDLVEWDLESLLARPAGSEESLAPDSFARSVAAELGLGGEWVTQIAHSIYEQLNTFRLVLASAPQSDAVKLVLKNFNRRLTSGLRPVDPLNPDGGPAYAPVLRKLSAEEQAEAHQLRQAMLAEDPLWVDLASEATTWASYSGDAAGHALLAAGLAVGNRRESRRLVSNRLGQSGGSRFGEW